MEISLVIPFYNEEENVKVCIQGISKHLDEKSIDYEIIAVNNNSSDNTGDIIQNLVNENPLRIKYYFESKKGYGNAIRGGLSIAQGKWIGWTDGDLQISNEDVYRVIEKTIDSNAIFCKAERRIRHDGNIRIIITTIYRLFISLLIRKRCYDVNGKPKFFRKSWYQKIQTQSEGWLIDAELIMKFNQMKAKFINVPIVFHTREKGDSSVNIKSLIKVIKEIRFLF